MSSTQTVRPDPPLVVPQALIGLDLADVPLEGEEGGVALIGTGSDRDSEVSTTADWRPRGAGIHWRNMSRSTREMPAVLLERECRRVGQAGHLGRTDHLLTPNDRAAECLHRLLRRKRAR